MQSPNTQRAQESPYLTRATTWGAQHEFGTESIQFPHPWSRSEIPPAFVTCMPHVNEHGTIDLVVPVNCSGPQEVCDTITEAVRKHWIDHHINEWDDMYNLENIRHGDGDGYDPARSRLVRATFWFTVLVGGSVICGLIANAVFKFYGQ